MSENTMFDAFSDFHEEENNDVRLIDYTADEDNERLDASVARNLEITRSAAAKLIEHGCVGRRENGGQKELPHVMRKRRFGAASAGKNV